MQSLTALVTAGGSAIALDDVRSLVDRRSAGLGGAIARHLRHECGQVRLMASETSDPEESRCATPGYGGLGDLQVERFRTVSDMRRQLDAAIVSLRPGIVVLTTPYRDWTLAQAPDVDRLPEGKHECTVRLLRTPAVTSGLRRTLGSKSFIVATLAAPVKADVHLARKARKHMFAHGLDLMIAFDRRTERDEFRDILLVTPEGGDIRLSGTDVDIAAALVTFIMKRLRTEPVPMGAAPGLESPSREHAAWDEAANLLAYAAASNSYSGTSGNLSVRLSAMGDMLVTPTGADKRHVTLDDMVTVRVDPTEPGLVHAGTRRPSIDTNVQAAIYRRFPTIGSILHVHADAGIFLTDAITSFPYPCGTAQEADDVVATIEAAGTGDRPFSIELIHHGFLLGLEPGGPQRLTWEWRTMQANLVCMAYDSGRMDDLKRHKSLLTLRPIYASSGIVGFVADHAAEGWRLACLPPRMRKRGYGERLATELARQGRPAFAPDRATERWYCTHGWQVSERRPEGAILIPPQERRDLCSAATVCLVEPSSRMVLLGKRKHSPWRDAWACPGGTLKDWEKRVPLRCALRELREETGIDLDPALEPTLVLNHVAGTYRGSRAFDITTYVYFVERIPEYQASGELDPETVELETALTDLPMGRGTKSTLRRVAAELDKRFPKKIAS